mmetsp:Transcript_1399/g.5694  ORF Transcript_1399/g.5694 Transcript_1399/m.5694 type:complete len:234 (-) Transcript_1399:800-1501(-)
MDSRVVHHRRRQVTRGARLARYHPILVATLDEQFPNFDPFATRAQSILHSLSRSNDGNPAKLAAKRDALVLVARRREDDLLAKRQVSQPMFDDETNDAVAVKDEIASIYPAIAYDGVHASDLELRRQNHQVAINAPQIILAELCSNVLDDEIDGHRVLSLRPRNDDIGIFLARRHKGVEHRLHERRVLCDDAIDASSSIHGVSLQPPRQSQIIVRVHEHFHVAHRSNLFHRQH